MHIPAVKCFLWAGVGILVLMAFSACSSPPPPTHEKLEYGQTVSGKVTYKGKPVVFGYVLMFHHEKSFDPQTNMIAPTGVAEIKDGKYTLENVPIGPAGICVATNPDIHPSQLVQAQKMDIKPDEPGQGPAGGTPGGPPGVPPQPGGMPPGGPPMPGGPGDPPMSPPGPGIPPLPPPGMEGIPGNPAMGPESPTAKLSEDQKDILREIHERFGNYSKSSVGTVVRQGEQTFDITLK